MQVHEPSRGLIFSQKKKEDKSQQDGLFILQWAALSESAFHTAGSPF